MKTLLSMIALGAALSFSHLAQAGDDYRESQGNWQRGGQLRGQLSGSHIGINILIPSTFAAIGVDRQRYYRVANDRFMDDQIWDDDDDDDWDDRDNDDDGDDDDD